MLLPQVRNPRAISTGSISPNRLRRVTADDVRALAELVGIGLTITAVVMLNVIGGIFFAGVVLITWSNVTAYFAGGGSNADNRPGAGSDSPTRRA